MRGFVTQPRSTGVLSLGRIDCMFELPARHVAWRIEVYPAILLFLIFICIFARAKTLYYFRLLALLAFAALCKVMVA